MSKAIITVKIESGLLKQLQRECMDLGIGLDVGIELALKDWINSKDYRQIVTDVVNAYTIDGDEIDRDIGVGNVLEKWRLVG